MSCQGCRRISTDDSPNEARGVDRTSFRHQSPIDVVATTEDHFAALLGEILGGRVGPTGGS
jgi:hypothetical protein